MKKMITIGKEKFKKRDTLRLTVENFDIFCMPVRAFLLSLIYAEREQCGDRAKLDGKSARSARPRNHGYFLDPVI